jgi:hypothetical protein
VGIGEGWEERTGFPDPDTNPQTIAVLPTFTLLDVVRHWQVYFPVLADGSYVSDTHAVWVVVTIDIDVIVDDAIPAPICVPSRDVVMVKIWVLVQTPPKEEVVVGIEVGLDILCGGAN